MLKINVLDKGFVEVVDSLGNDLTVVNSAEKLVNYLAKHKHYSPFRHLQIQFHIKAPEFVMRQWYKHIVGIETTSNSSVKDHAWNEISGRYVQYQDFYEPDVWRKQSKDNKQASEGHFEDRDELLDIQAKWKQSHYMALTSYQGLIEKGIEEGAELVTGGPGKPDGLKDGYQGSTNVTTLGTIATLSLIHIWRCRRRG